jgi:manganese/iron transport system ATP-binding protein
MWQIYNELKQEGKTLLISCHEWGDSLERYDQLLLLNRQLIASGTPRQVLTSNHILNAYGASISQIQHSASTIVNGEDLLFC